MTFDVYGIVETLCGWVKWPILNVMEFFWVLGREENMMVELSFS